MSEQAQKILKRIENTHTSKTLGFANEMSSKIILAQPEWFIG